MNQHWDLDRGWVDDCVCVTDTMNAETYQADDLVLCADCGRVIDPEELS